MLFDFIRLGQPTNFMHRHRLAGTVTVDGQPASRLICVFDRLTKVLLAAKWSDAATGAWEIAGMNEYPRRRLFVAAFDSEGNYNAEIADYVSQVVSPGQMEYSSVYPPAYSSDYVKATSRYDTSSEPWFVTDPAKPLTGTNTSNCWLSAYAVLTNQKFNVDLGTAKVIRRLILENFHTGGSGYDIGIKNFSIYGSNSSAAFLNVDYASLSDLTLLGEFTARPHALIDQSDPQYFVFNNDTAYRYIILRIADNQGGGTYMGLRHIELQTQDD